MKKPELIKIIKEETLKALKDRDLEDLEGRMANDIPIDAIEPDDGSFKPEDYENANAIKDKFKNVGKTGPSMLKAHLEEIEEAVDGIKRQLNDIATGQHRVGEKHPMGDRGQKTKFVNDAANEIHGLVFDIQKHLGLPPFDRK